jgi:hypothetical protein
MERMDPMVDDHPTGIDDQAGQVRRVRHLQAG